MKPRAVPRLDRLEAAGLVAVLENPSGTLRDMAQQLLVARKDAAAVPHLKQLTANSSRPVARLHALCTLDGLASLDVATLLRAG